MLITDLKIKQLLPKSKSYRVTDSEGLCLEISSTGSKLWRWRYYYLGKSQMMSLGKYPAVSLAAARKKRNDAKDLLAAGKNPCREKKKERLRKTYEHENSFEKMARRSMEIRGSALSEKYNKQCIARMEQHVFPKIGTLPITEITIPEVVAVIEAIGEQGSIETAKRMRQLISQTFRYAAQRGLCQYNPAADLRDILPQKEKKHFACIDAEELSHLIKKIDARADDFTKYAMKLLMLTFVRTGELIGAKWEEISWEKREWHIPKERMKMKRPHIVPLSDQVITLLRDLEKITGGKGHIFHSAASKSMHISNGAVLMGLRRMGYKNKMTGHGFRTLASTILHERGYLSDVIERQLAHEDGDKIRAAYNRAEYLPERKKMMQDYADFIDSVRAASDNVTPK